MDLNSADEKCDSGARDVSTADQSKIEENRECRVVQKTRVEIVAKESNVQLVVCDGGEGRGEGVGEAGGCRRG